ncbi:hypothetical protein VD0002_g175 [Verticillium dahliae]|uniref:Uncharacterized protein n=1 Tax=Verticillium dahliae TaxID=27337 RepID=A0AA45AR71_VERDA|nr:hypothetical protein BJF96_g1231 [Verticillium dahliae]PNH48475.1 hypothetical protein VD0004_g102 [Verticillium dahliae]PNH57446.1 hypothetical protein VD0003_g440 [Verticillium dahliae]PNH70514.1 hypothetical protein VD0002_g175 [Verticillium dahliae]PNH74131.1 hypothetical protein VD0001_g3395 [Verticillium dahliae]
MAHLPSMTNGFNKSRTIVDDHSNNGGPGAFSLGVRRSNEVESQ